VSAVRAATIQDKVAANSSTNSKTASLGTAPTAGNLLILCSGIASTATITSITQTNVVWSKVASTTSLSPTCEIWKGVVSASAGTSIAVAYSGAAFNSWWCGEFSGLSGTLDQSSISVATSTANYVTGTITPSTSATVIAMMATDSGSIAFTNFAVTTNGCVYVTPTAMMAISGSASTLGTLIVGAYTTTVPTAVVFQAAGGNHTSIILDLT
jgi:hypothetical protein